MDEYHIRFCPSLEFSPRGYCGVHGNLSIPCQLGERINYFNGDCIPCSSKWTFYEFLFYAGIVTVVLEFYSIFTWKSRIPRYQKFGHFFCSIIELTCAVYSTYIFFKRISKTDSVPFCDPWTGIITQNFFPYQNYSIFYTMLCDPLDLHTFQRIQCTSETVYPLYSSVLMFLAFLVVFLCAIRLPFMFVIIDPGAFNTTQIFNWNMKIFYDILKTIPLLAVIYSLIIGVYYWHFFCVVHFICFLSSLDKFTKRESNDRFNLLFSVNLLPVQLGQVIALLVCNDPKTKPFLPGFISFADFNFNFLILLGALLSPFVYYIIDYFNLINPHEFVIIHIDKKFLIPKKTLPKT